MSKLAKLARVIGTLAGNPKSIANVLLDPDEVIVQRRIAREYNLGKGLPTIDLLDLLPNLDENVDPFCFMNGSSRTVDLAVLKGLARRLPRCRYLEIGTLRGESIVNMALIAEECVSVSLSEEEILQRGWGTAYARNNGLFLEGVPRLTRIAHDSATLDFSTLGKFDMIFVDGDHSYEGVRKDTQNSFSLLRDEKSIIVWHDYGIEYDTPRWSVMAGILDGTPASERGCLYHISNTLCALYIRGEFPTSFVEHPAVPNKVFAVRVTARRL